MGQRYSIDSNVIIDFFEKRFNTRQKDYLIKIFNNDFYLSFVVFIEVLGYETPPQKLNQINGLLSLGEKVMINEDIIQTCINIRKSKRIKLGDAIIAAASLETNSTLLTNNTKDFQGVENLKVINSHKI